MGRPGVPQVSGCHPDLVDLYFVSTAEAKTVLSTDSICLFRRPGGLPMIKSGLSTAPGLVTSALVPADASSRPDGGQSSQVAANGAY